MFVWNFISRATFYSSMVASGRKSCIWLERIALMSKLSWSSPEPFYLTTIVLFFPAKLWSDVELRFLPKTFRVGFWLRHIRFEARMRRRIQACILWHVLDKPSLDGEMLEIINTLDLCLFAWIILNNCRMCLPRRNLEIYNVAYRPMQRSLTL